MRSRSSLYGRIARRESHSPRSTPAIAVAGLVILACVYLATEIILSLSRQPALLISPTMIIAALIALSTFPAGIMISAGIVVAFIGVVLIVLALKAGRLARHVHRTERTVIVVDDEVIASALARHASYAGGINPDNARVSVSRSRATVHLTPTSGTFIERQAVIDAVAAQLHSYELSPSLRATVIINENGTVCA